MRKLQILFLCGFVLSVSCQNIGRNPSEPVPQKPDYQITENSIRQHILFLASDSMKGRATGTPEMETVRQYISNCFDSAGLNKLASYGDSYLQRVRLVKQVTDWLVETGIADSLVCKPRAYNVVGILPGRDSVLSNEYIVVGAHYDHVGTGLFSSFEKTKSIHNGADDNASGTAVMIELANKMNSLRDSLKRSLIFIAYDAEELGLLGSYFFVANPPIGRSKIKLAVNLDMVGRLIDSSGVAIMGGNLFKNGEEWITEAAKSANIPIYNTDKNIYNSDHYHYYENKIPFIMPMPNLHKDYHTGRDKEEKINYNGALNTAAFLTEMLKTVCNTDSIVAIPDKFHKLNYF